MKRNPIVVLIFVICGIVAAGFAGTRLPNREKIRLLTGEKARRIEPQNRPKTLRERARERDVEVEGAGDQLADIDLGSLKSESHAIVYGRILNTRSFFEESPSEIESGENITTEYEFQIARVLKDTTTEVIPLAPKPAPALLISPLRIARNGGVVSVNGHRASVKVKGFDAIESGKSYVMFLNWSPDYRAYVPTAGIFGVVAVSDDRGLRSLSSSN
jgi:hypothetical protein